MFFYSQVLRYQRLCTHIVDFNERTKILGGVLLQRGYMYKKLCKQFIRVVNKYRHEFERWEVPSNVHSWFSNIINNPLAN